MSCEWEDKEPKDYIVSCDDVKCPTADDRTTFSSGGDRAVTCIWDCTDYNGEYRYVDRTWWSWGGECFVEEDVFTADCI